MATKNFEIFCSKGYPFWFFFLLPPNDVRAGQPHFFGHLAILCTFAFECIFRMVRIGIRSAECFDTPINICPTIDLIFLPHKFFPTLIIVLFPHKSHVYGKKGTQFTAVFAPFSYKIYGEKAPNFCRVPNLWCKCNYWHEKRN